MQYSTQFPRESIPPLPRPGETLPQGLDLALYWAARGCRVIPVRVEGDSKKPCINGWRQLATTDGAAIRKWWAEMPHAQVGIVTGAPGYDVVDFDVKDGKRGKQSWDLLADTDLLDGYVMKVTTQSGGWHLYFAGTEQGIGGTGECGVDFRATGGWVVAPGNPGYQVEWSSGEQPQPVDWRAIEDLLRPEGSPGRPSSTGRRSETTPRVSVPLGPLSPPESPYGTSPLDDYVARNDLLKLLEADGWYVHPRPRQGKWDLTRPGKNPRDGVSANVAEIDGRQVLYIFSESVTDLPIRQGLSAAEWYAWRYHGGDFKAATRALREQGYGDPLPSTGRASETGTGIETPPDVPAPVEDTPEFIHQFWNRRPYLYYISWLARARRTNPWAVLGVVLAHAACRIGPHVVLPPIVGGYASLNLLVGLIGGSGSGKDNSIKLGALLMPSPLVAKKLGTGQGIEATYSAPTREGPIQYNDVALFTIPEIDTLTSHTRQQGATIMPTLREVYSGSALGSMYKDWKRRLRVEDHTYRAAVVAGIQPTRADVLLDDVDGGTPQRWLWMPANKPKLGRFIPPDWPYTDLKLWVDYEVWLPQGEQGEDPIQPKDRIEVQVCQTAWNQILEYHDQADDDNPARSDLDGHALLTRLKVAALLGFLDRRCEVNDEDWELAGIVMWVSNRTRAKVQRALAEKAQEQAAARGRARARQAAAERQEAAKLEDEQEDKLQSVAARLRSKLQQVGGWVSRRDLSRFLGRDGGYCREGLRRLVDAGVVEADERSGQYRIKA